MTLTDVLLTGGTLMASLLVVAMAVWPRHGLIEPFATTGLMEQRIQDMSAGGAASSRTLYRESANDAEYYKRLQDQWLRLSDRDDLLVMNRCLRFPVDAKRPWTEAFADFQADAEFPIEVHRLRTSDFTAVRSKVLESMQAVVDAHQGAPIPGPVYILVSQSPYYRDTQGRTVSVQFNAATYQYKPSVVPSGTQAPLLDVFVAILYPMLDTKKQYTQRTWADVSCSMKWLLNHRAKDNACFLQCAGDANSFCGCKNAKAPYEAKCLGPDGSEWQGKPMDYAVLYTAQPYHKYMLYKSFTGWSPVEGCTKVGGNQPPAMTTVPPRFELTDVANGRVWAVMSDDGEMGLQDAKKTTKARPALTLAWKDQAHVQAYKARGFKALVLAGPTEDAKNPHMACAVNGVLRLSKAAGSPDNFAFKVSEIKKNAVDIVHLSDTLGERYVGYDDRIQRFVLVAATDARRRRWGVKIA